MKLKRFLSLLIVALLAINVTACGPIGEEPDIDEGLHIAADDAQQRIDRDDNVQSEDNSNLDDDDSDESDSAHNSTSTDDEEGFEPQPESPGNNIAQPLDDPKGEGTDFTYDSGGRTYVDLDPETFWVDDNTFDLQGYVEACNAEFLFLAADVNAAYEYEDPHLDKHDEAVTEFLPCVNSVQIHINTDATGAANANHLYAWDDGKFDHFVEVLGPCEPWKDCKLVNIVGFDQKISSRTLQCFITLFRRILNEDQGCQLRGLDVKHWSSYNKNHVD